MTLITRPGEFVPELARQADLLRTPPRPVK